MCTLCIHCLVTATVLLLCICNKNDIWINTTLSGQIHVVFKYFIFTGNISHHASPTLHCSIVFSYTVMIQDCWRDIVILKAFIKRAPKMYTDFNVQTMSIHLNNLLLYPWFSFDNTSTEV
jgi:hypothetical protein